MKMGKRMGCRFDANLRFTRYPNTAKQNPQPCHYWDFMIIYS